MNLSLVDFTPHRSGHSCGYCKSSDGNWNHGMWAHYLTVQDYQDLIDRGWRRSGMYCYKPSMNITCCPAYTIKCSALDFRLTKSQKKILKRMRRFLIDGKKSIADDKESTHSDEDPQVHNEPLLRLNMTEPLVNLDVQKLDTSMLEECNSECQFSNNNNDSKNLSLPDVPSDISKLPETELKNSSESLPSELCKQNSDSSPTNKKKNHPRDSSKPAMKKAKLIRLERRAKKLSAKMMNSENDDEPSTLNIKKVEQQSKSLEDFLYEPLPNNTKHNLEVKVVNFTEPDDQTTELFNLEHRLYQKYQVTIHKDDLESCSQSSFRRFLVTSPLKLDASEATVYGSFHQQYWLDGQLIAVGVIDILPYCVSSVYFFYDPDYSFLSLGTYSALREVALTRSLQSNAPLLKYYYMGFYIHSCPKMRYKGRIGPAFLLCPEIYTWHPIEFCIPKLDANKYSRLNDDLNEISRDSDVDLDKILVYWEERRAIVDFKKYKRSTKKKIKMESITLYAKLVGRRCAHRMIVLFN